MKCATLIAIAAIGLLTLQCSVLEARFLGLTVIENIHNRVENIRDKIKEQLQHWHPGPVTRAPVVPEQPQVIDTTAGPPDFHFPEEEEEEVNHETAEVTTVQPEDTTESRRLIEVPLINGGCPSGYRRVGDRCREVFSGRRRRRR